MPRLLLLAVAVLCFAGPAEGASFRGYVTPESRAWIAEAKMPMPSGSIVLSRNACPLGGGTCTDAGYNNRARPIIIFLAADYDWSQNERKFLLYHELGHAYDITRMTPSSRKQFRRAISVHCAWAQTWRNGCGAVPPQEMFAEQYAACAADIPRAELIGTDAEFYTYAVPSWISEIALCDLIRT